MSDAPPAPSRSRPSRSFLAAVAAPVVLLALVAAWSITWFARVSHEARRVEVQDVPLAVAANDLRVEVAGMLQGQTSYVLYAGTGRATFEARLERVDGVLDRLGRMAQRPGERALLAKMRSEVSAFRAVDTHIWSALQQGNADAARGLTLGPNALTATFLGEDAGELATQTQRVRDQALANIDQRLRTGVLVTVVLGALAVAVGIASGVFTMARGRRPFRLLDEAATRALAGVPSVDADDGPEGPTARVRRALNQLVAQRRSSDARLAADRALRTAFDRVDDEDEAFRVVADALGHLPDAGSTELLVVDDLEATVVQRAVHGTLPGGPACPVGSLGACAAARAAGPLVFVSPTALGACPKLAGRPYGPVSAACVPVMFLGRPLGVLHSIAAEGEPPPPDRVDDLDTIAAHLAPRLGALRAQALADLDLDA